VTAVLGLLTAGLLALINSWITARAGVDEGLRTKRLTVYPTLWNATGAVARWPRNALTVGSLEELHRSLRSWYYEEGGLFMSEAARARYGEVQEMIAALLQGSAASTDRLHDAAYADLMHVTSALRTAMTEDLDTRRRKSAWETLRRSRWHRRAAQAAKQRIERASEAESFGPYGGDGAAHPSESPHRHGPRSS
jgi:hypothetical protein